jgi:hypothetical protein
MRIDRTNYEVFFIDLLDGALSGKALDEVLDFIQENPDLAEELKGLDDFRVIPEALPELNISSLLKSDLDHPELLQETCVRAVEKQLSAGEEAAFNQYIHTHPKAKNEYRLFQATISKPDYNVVYPYKKSLKRTRLIGPLWYSLAAAFVLGFFFWFTNKNNEEPVQIVQHTEITSEKNQSNPAIPEKIETEIKAEAKVEKEQKVVVKSKITKPEVVGNESLAIRTVENFEPLVAVNVVKVDGGDGQLFADLMPFNGKQREEAENQTIYPTIPELIAQKISTISFRSEASKFGKVALDRISTVTNEKLSYKTNGKGNVEKIEFSSKLLAFSFPIGTSDQ